MDPDEALREALKLSDQIITEPLDDEELEEAARELAEKLEALDNWIRQGGFLPKRWRARR